MIDGRGINNVCDVLMYLEDDDTRDVGVMTLPLFFPFLWFALCEKNGWFMYATALAISATGCSGFSALSVCL